MEDIKITNLTIGPFNKFNCSFPINSFSIVAGNNKSGKSLLIKVLGSLVYTKNKVFYNDISIDNYNFNDLNKIISYVNLDAKLIFNTVIDEIKYPLEEKGVEKDNILKIIKSVSNDLNMDDILNEKISSISHFNKIKIMIAKSLVLSPKVLLLDDPCKYLTLDEKGELVGIIEKFVTMGGTVIMSTSNLEDAIYTINSNLFILNNGEIISSGAVLDVLSDDSLINKAGFDLPFMVDLCVKLKYYDLVDKMILDPLGLVNILWK